MYTSFFRKAMLGDTATLNLDFTTGTVPTAVTFTRADSTARATYIDASGYVKTVAAAGDARFDYDPGTLAPRGLLIESQAVNYMLESKTLVGYSNSSMASVTTGSETDPEGTANAARQVYASSGGTYHGYYRNTTAGTNTTITVSIWAKARDYTYLFLSEFGSGTAAVRFNLSSGAISNNLGAGYVSAKATSFPNGWWRCEMVVNVTASTGYNWMFSGVPVGATLNQYGAQYTGTGNAADGIYCYGFQVQGGSGASSYIPTTTAALTRLADDAVIRSTAWTGLYSKPGSIVVEYYRGEYGAGDRSVLAIDTAATKHIHLKHANASAASGIYNSAGSGVANKLAGNASGLNKAAFNWDSANPSTIKYALNGNATVVSGSSDIGATLGTWMTIGSASTTGVSGSGTWEGYLNNSIKSVKYYSELLSDADMIAKTT
jgi:hypothetical protein